MFQKGVSVVGQRIFNRETRESVYGLFFLVRAVPVVRGLEKNFPEPL